MIKSRRIRSEGHAAGMEEMIHECNILVGKPEGKRKLGRPRRRWRIILKCVLKKWCREVWIRFIWFRDL
jgi:hypothetical protein